MEKFKDEIIKLNSNSTFINYFTREEDLEMIYENEINIKEQQKSIEIARNMLKLGLDIDIINKSTDLSIKEIKKLSNKNNQET